MVGNSKKKTYAEAVKGVSIKEEKSGKEDDHVAGTWKEVESEWSINYSTLWHLPTLKPVQCIFRGRLIFLRRHLDKIKLTDSDILIKESKTTGSLQAYKRGELTLIREYINKDQSSVFTLSSGSPTSGSTSSTEVSNSGARPRISNRARDIIHSIAKKAIDFASRYKN
jgi:hypothetical protein